MPWDTLGRSDLNETSVKPLSNLRSANPADAKFSIANIS